MLRCISQRQIAAATIAAALTSHFARPYGGNQIKSRTKCYRSHHDSVRGNLSLTKINRVLRGGRCHRLKPTVARMPQGKAKSGFPHEPQRTRLPLDHRFGMLQPGVKVVVEVVTMRQAPW
jgi:hypothetical protein